MWVESLNLVGVLAASDLRRAENIYYLEDLQEAPVAPLGPKADVAPVATVLEQLPSPQVSIPPSPWGFQRA